MSKESPYGNKIVALFDRRVVASLILLGILAFVGAAGYRILDHVGWFDALYMTMNTMTTVGFREVWSLSRSSQVWTLFIMLAGIGMFFLIIGQIAQEMVDFKRIRRIRMQNQVKSLSDHYIVCGFGRMGRAVADEFTEEQIPFVVVEHNPEKIPIIVDLKYLLIEGDATRDEILQQAGIERAKGLIAVLANDAENLFLTLTARSLSKKLYILARSMEIASRNKLLRAGADKVINPYETAGHKMARMAIKPGVVEFVEVATHRTKVDLTMETITVRSGSGAEGKSLIGLDLRKQYNLIVTAITSPGGASQFNPDPTYKLEAGDVLLTLGNLKNLQRFERLCSES